MIQKFWIVILLMSSFAAGQATAPAAQKPENKQAPKTTAPPATEAKPAEVAPDAPVITLNGVCEKQPAAVGQCQTIVTRAQFEKLIAALAQTPAQQSMPAERRRQLAVQYSRLLAAAAEAEKRGLQNTPETQELLHFARMQALTQELSRDLQRKAQPTPEEMQKHYQENAAKLEQVTLQKILIPVLTGTAAKPGKDELKTFADQLQKRAAAGEDFDKLQKEAYDKVGMQNAPDATVVVQPGNLTPDEQAVVKLKPGEVSQVFSQPTVFIIYKFVERKPVPFEQVKSEIQSALQQQKFQAEVEKLLNNSTPVLNEAYFGPAPAPDGTALPGPGGTGGRPRQRPPRQPSQPPQK